MSDSSLLREAFKVRIGDYLSEHELEGLGISADWYLYLSPTIRPALATCFTQFNTYELLACPCFGGGATIIGTYPTNEFSAICRGCGLETAHKLTPNDAASDWNKRHAPDEEGAALRAQPAGGGCKLLTDERTRCCEKAVQVWAVCADCEASDAAIREAVYGAASPQTAECKHRYVRDQEAILHHCCQLCGHVKRDEEATPPESGGQGHNANQRLMPVNVMGGPMREYAPGKWENAIWPSDHPPAQESKE